MKFSGTRNVEKRQGRGISELERLKVSRHQQEKNLVYRLRRSRRERERNVFWLQSAGLTVGGRVAENHASWILTSQPRREESPLPTLFLTIRCIINQEKVEKNKLFLPSLIDFICASSPVSKYTT